MKLLFTVQHYYPRISGIPVVTQYLAEGLHALGHVVSIVTTRDSGSPRFERHNGIEIHRFDLFHSKLFGYYGEKRAYFDFVNSFDADVIICECVQTETTDLLFRGFEKFRVPIILHSHGFSGLTLRPFEIRGSIKHTLGNTYNWLRWRIYYWRLQYYLRFYAHIVTTTNGGSDRAFLNKYAVSEVSVLGNAARGQYFGSNYTENKLWKYADYAGNKYLLSVANFTAVKNQKLLVEAFYECGEENVDLVLIGSQKTKFYHELLRQKQGLDKVYGFRSVHMLTGVDSCDLVSIVAHAKLYLVGSLYEEYSIAIIEAMALGVPFVSTDVGNAGMLPGGVVVRSESEMARAISSLLNDERHRRELGDLAQRYAIANCREECLVRKLEAIIYNVCNNSC